MKYKVCDECLTTYNPDTVDRCPACSMTIMDKQKRYPVPVERVRLPKYEQKWNMETKRYDLKEL